MNAKNHRLYEKEHLTVHVLTFGESLSGRCATSSKNDCMLQERKWQNKLEESSIHGKTLCSMGGHCDNMTIGSEYTVGYLTKNIYSDLPIYISRTFGITLRKNLVSTCEICPLKIVTFGRLLLVQIFRWVVIFICPDSEPLFANSIRIQPKQLWTLIKSRPLPVTPDVHLTEIQYLETPPK